MIGYDFRDHNDPWGDLGPEMEGAPEPWLADRSLTPDARHILNWLCQQPCPLAPRHAVAFAHAVIHNKPDPEAAITRGEAAALALHTAGYFAPETGSPESTTRWVLTWRTWARPDGGETTDITTELS